MPKIHKEFTQLSPEWLAAHVGRPTASEFKNIMTPLFKAKTGDGFNTYVATKLAEAWRGRPLGGFSTFATEQGQLREDEARPLAMLELDYDIIQVGFIEGDDGRCGCSPDGLIGEDDGIEIKCPEPKTHVGYFLDGCLPDEHSAQVHGSLYVSGRQRWRFMSYAVGFPPFMLTIERDEAIMAKIQAALAAFYLAFDAGMQRLREADSSSSPKPA